MHAFYESSERWDSQYKATPYNGVHGAFGASSSNAESYKGTYAYEFSLRPFVKIPRASCNLEKSDTVMFDFVISAK